MSIEVKNISKRYGNFQALDSVNLSFSPGSLVALLGPSGSGKSTLLRVIAGLESPDQGSVSLVGQDATFHRVQERNIGFLFQHYALFKHLTVRENIAFALDIRKAPPQAIKERVDRLLDLVQLAGLGGRYPSQLSGGQRQRVALARALAVQPKVLLLDEPFGALDAKVRKELRAWLRQLHRETDVTTVFVTHDQEEAMEVADEIVVMNQGKVEQVGSPREIYDNPATSFVMGFIGPVNVLSPFGGPFAQWAQDQAEPTTQDSRLFLRPHDVEIATAPIENALPATVHHVVHLGWEVQVELHLDQGSSLTAQLDRDAYQKLHLERLQKVYTRPRAIRLFPVAA